MEATITRNTLKSIVSGLRREIGATADPKKLSHAQMLELFARALGKPTYAALLAELPEDKTAEEVAVSAKPESVLLVNEGQFDLVARGESARLLPGLLNGDLQGTSETIRNCIAYVSQVSRLDNGRFSIEYSGSTEVSWNDQRTDRGPNGKYIWVTESGDDLPEEQCVAVPAENFCLEDALEHPDYDRVKPRMALVAAFANHLRHLPPTAVIALKRELSEDVTKLGPVLNKLEDDLGFALIASERVALLQELTE